jgi:hypothetical protein
MKGLLKEVGIRDELPTREVTCSRERKQSRAQEVVEAKA